MAPGGLYQTHCSVGYIDLHEFWSNSSEIPAKPPCLATDCDDCLLDITIGGQLDSSGNTCLASICYDRPGPFKRGWAIMLRNKSFGAEMTETSERERGCASICTRGISHYLSSSSFPSSASVVSLNDTARSFLFAPDHNTYPLDFSILALVSISLRLDSDD